MSDDFGKASTRPTKVQNRFFLLVDVVVKIALDVFVENRLLLFVCALSHVAELSVDCFELLDLHDLGLL